VLAAPGATVHSAGVIGCRPFNPNPNPNPNPYPLPLSLSPLT
jgi:hypothetical protein